MAAGLDEATRQGAPRGEYLSAIALTLKEIRPRSDETDRFHAGAKLLELSSFVAAPAFAPSG
jgi:hypothetical protein